MNGAGVSAELGEFELIERLAARLEPAGEGLGIGDDAAAWMPAQGALAVATTDMLIEGIHFRLDWTTPRDLGWKALAVNLSDLAAMGAKPGRALVSIGLQRGQASLVEEMYEGMAELARLTGTRIVGGDTVRTPGPLIVNVALYGEADPERLLRRGTAKAGDLVAVTGRVGLSGAGLDLLLAGDPELLARPEAAPLLAAHHRPVPRLAAGAALAQLGVRCAIDVSDGVASEARHLAEESGVAIEIDVDHLPLAAEALSLLGDGRARHLALSGGEDYELLFTLPGELLDEIAAVLPPDSPPTVIGRVTAAVTGGSVTFREAGRPVELDPPGYVAF
jgi:thiamine-monophosphate kinase